MPPSDPSLAIGVPADAPSADAQALAAIVALIGDDTRQAPAEYLEETVVPHGGE